MYARHPQAVEEVNAAIASGYYEDETVLVKDLLRPESSSIYQLPSFKERSVTRHFEVGSFKIAIEKELGVSLSTSGRTKDLYFFDEELSIYFPYHEITQYSGYPVTTLPATTEADSAPAPHPLCDDLNPSTWAYCSQTVTVNDDYAYAYPTHITGMGGQPADQTQDVACTNVKVSVGYVQVKKHYDALISFTGNKGGAELYFVSAKANSGSATVTSFNRSGYKHIGRKQVRDQDWVAVWTTLDANWTESASTQMFGIYDWDNTSTVKSFTGTVAFFDGATTSFPGYNIGVNSKDPIIYNTVHHRANMVSLAQTYGSTPEYLTGYGPQYTADKGNVKFSTPVGCY